MLSSINKFISILFIFAITLLSTLTSAAVHHAGTTLGSFDVDAQGAATYSIPLEVPPGINGMQPNLSLNYNSQSGNGLLGMGWSLGGLSSISRCAQNLAQDGKIHGVNFSNQDRFCLNGQRLVAVNGVYGADGTEYKTATATYSKIISNGVAGSGPASFKVWSKSGQVMEYGVTADSRIEAQGRSDVLTWAVNQISSTTGNKMTFSYIEDNANGFYHIDRIDYGYVSTTPSMSVRFTTEGRSDIENSFILGGTITTLKRLQEINLFVNSSNIKKYQLDYMYSLSTGKSKVTKYTECDVSSICKPSSSFDWLESIANKFEGTEDWTSTGTADVTVAGITDVTGDGLADLILQYDNLGIRNWAVFVSDGTKFVNKETWAATGTADVTVAGITDVTGDGLADLILQYDNLGIRNWAVFVSDGTKFVNKETWAATGTADVTVAGITDVTGDGLADLILQYDNLGIRNWTVFVSDGTKFVNKETWAATGTADVTVAGITDVTGDGLADLILQYDNLGIRNWAVFVSDGTKFVNKETWAATGTADVTVAGITDVTGDGLADLILQYDNLGIRNWTVFVSDGTKFVNKETWAATGTADVTVAGITDVTGDGVADLTLQYDNLGIRNWAVFVSDGTKFVNKETWTATSTAGVTVSGLTDVTGDGVADLILQYDNLGARRWAGRVSNSSFSDKLSSITNGLGEQTNITYKPLTDNLVYTKYTTSTYPVRDVQAPRYVVSSSSKSNGIGGLYSHSYKYEGLRTHLKGRGSLGFAKQIITDDQTGVVKETYYRQDFPYTGLVDSSITKLSNGATISETTNSWNDILNGNPDTIISSTNRFSPQLVSSSESSYELDGSFVAKITKSQSYDADGNVLQVIVDSNDGYTKTNNNTYYPKNEINWFIGQLESSSVTNKTPTDLSGLTRSSRFEYDPATGLLTKEIIEPNDPNLELVKTNIYDTYGNKTSITVSGAGILARTTTHSFDYSGLFNPISTMSVTSTNALGHSETKVIDARWGKVASLTGPNNLTTTWSFDTLGRKVREDRADGNWTTIDYTLCETSCAYDSPLQITKTVAGSSPITIYYDMLGREVMKESTAFDGRTIYKASNYDGFGRVASTSLPYFSAATAQWHTYQYDILGRNTKENFPDSSSTSVIYAGLTTTYINNKGQVTKKVNNTQGKLIQSIDSASNSNFYQYDALGYLTSVTDAVGNTTSMSYNKRGHKISMDDPDMGHWEYAYNVFGKLVWQKDAKGQEATIEYDLLNRMTKRTEIEGVSEWFYDTAANGIGKLARVAGVNGFTQTIQYDTLGRAYDATTVVSGVSMTMQTAYDSLGRISSTTYPSGLSVKNIYNTLGFLSEVRNAANDSLYWQATGVDDAGRVNKHSLGNGVTTTKFFSLQTGRLEGIKSGLGVSGTEVQNLSYVFDDLGNLTSRHDGNKSLNEFFIYDGLNRLASATLSGQPTQSFTYDSIGNITSKTGVGSYLYGEGTAGPHAVTTAGGTTYAYDANGNQINGDGRTLTYTSFNKIKTMTKGVVSTSFDYDVNHNRIQQSKSNNNLLTVTRYLGKLYEVVNTPDGIVENKHYINTAGATILVTERSNAVNDTRYLLKDHLGSTDVITDEAGAVVESTSFDAFGARRDALSWAVASAAMNSLTTRGFTGHEMHDDFGLVNMNARMYDAKLGRFLQPDVFVQFPQSTQGFNRYTYVNNNPLSYTDPTGNFLNGLRKSVSRFFKKTYNVIKKVAVGIKDTFEKTTLMGKTIFSKPVKKLFLKNEWARQIGTIAASYFGGPMGAAAFSAYLTDIAGGSFEDITKSFATSYISSKMSAKINKYYGNTYNFSRVITESVSGGVTSGLSGGKFEDGFKSALVISGLTSAAMNMRYSMIEQSKIDGINAMGESAGFKGDGFKLGGGRYDANNPGAISLLGGRQGGQGSIFGYEYAPGSFPDLLVESFAGPHDYFNSGIWYDSMGNINNLSRAQQFIGTGLNYANVAFVTPFVAASVIHPYTNALIAEDNRF